MNGRELTRLYREHGWHVYHRSFRILGVEEEARDVCQDVFVRLLSARPQRDRRHELRAWLFRTTTNLCIDRLRLRKHHDPEAVDELVRPASDERRAIDRRFLVQLFERLSSEERQLVVLRWVDGCTLTEMEGLCGRTRKTLSKQLRRIRKRAEALRSSPGRRERRSP